MQQLILNFVGNPFLFFPFVVWLVIFKGVALWRAARNYHKKWFVAILILNTLTILEIVYLVFFSKPKEK